MYSVCKRYVEINKVPSVYSAKELRLIFEQDLSDMIPRYEWLQKNKIMCDHTPVSMIAHAYLNESFRCYLHGNHISFLTMLAFSFEILFRAVFDQGRFVNLINYALECKLITKREANEIHWLRNFRNTTHNVDAIFPVHGKRDYEIDFYRNPDRDISKMMKRGLKLVRIINRMQINGFQIRMRLLHDGKMRPPPDLSYLKKKF